MATARLRVGTAVASPNPSKAGDRGSVGVRIYSGFIVDLPIENDDLMGFIGLPSGKLLQKAMENHYFKKG